MIKYIDALGHNILSIFKSIGDFGMFGVKAVKTFIKKPLNRKQLLMQMRVIGVGSFGIVFLTGAFAGLALALQGYIGFSRVHAEQFTGLVVTLGMARELGPVLTGLMVTGRVGSAISAEIGTMNISEQIDALRTLGIDPFSYLIVPRILASTIVMPFVAIFTIIFGIVSSYALCVHVLSVNAESYLSIIEEYMELSDITGGLFKAMCFGAIFSWIGSYKGYNTRGGARGVGKSTIASVVLGSISILVANYILSSILYETGLS